MKKYLGVIALLLLCIAMVFTAQAKETTEYGVDVSYTVDIPERVELENGEGALAIVISEVTLPENHTLAVTVSGESNGENWIMHHDSADTTLEYVVHNGDTTVSSGDIVLQTTHPETITLDVEVVDYPTTAGNYTGVMTVSIDVNAGKYVPVAGLGNVLVNRPNAELTVDPNGGVSGIVPPIADQPEETPDLPTNIAPPMINFNLGKFETNAEFTPGEYTTVPYTVTQTHTKTPVLYQNVIWSKWQITKDGNGNIIQVHPSDITLADIETKYSKYIAYTFDTDEYLELEGVPGDSVKFYSIFAESEDSIENAVYLAAYLQHVTGSSLHIAQWDGNKYVAANYDAEIAAITEFTFTTTHTEYKTVEVSKPSTSVNYVLIPIGEMTAVEGMTWEEWLNSEYNTSGYTNPMIKTNDFQDVNHTDVIQPDHSYGFIEYALSGKWEFNKTLTSPQPNDRGVAWLYQKIDFVWAEYSTDFTWGDFSGSAIDVEYMIGDGIYMNYGNPNELVYSQDVWDEFTLRQIDFGDIPQNVSPEFYEWFVANARPYVLTEGSITLTTTHETAFWSAFDEMSAVFNLKFSTDVHKGAENFIGITTDDPFIYYYNDDGEWYGWCYEFVMEGLMPAHTIHLTEPQYISPTLHDWLMLNSIETNEVSGVWQFNEALTPYWYSDLTESVSFKTVHNNVTYQSISYFSIYYKVKYGTYEVYTRGNQWGNSQDRVIDFGTMPQKVSAKFYIWLHENATKIS